MAYNTETEARELAHNIRMFWLEQGYDVAVAVVKEAVKLRGGDTESIYTIKSDMINGRPRRRLATTAIKGNA